MTFNDIYTEILLLLIAFWGFVAGVCVLMALWMIWDYYKSR